MVEVEELGSSSQEFVSKYGVVEGGGVVTTPLVELRSGGGGNIAEVDLLVDEMKGLPAWLSLNISGVETSTDLQTFHRPEWLLTKYLRVCGMNMPKTRQ